MGLLRRCALLWMWGGVLVAVGAAPLTEEVRDEDAKDTVADFKESSVRRARDLIPCLSNIGGYGLCDDHLFTSRPYGDYPDVHYDRIINTQQPGYYQRDITKSHHLPYQQPYTKFPMTPDNQQMYPTFTPQNVFTDQFVMIINPKRNDHETSSKDAAMLENDFLHPDASQPDHRITKLQEKLSASFHSERKIDFKELEAIFKDIDEISKNATNAILEAVSLKEEIEKGASVPGDSASNRLNGIFVNLEQLAKNIKVLTTTLIDTEIHYYNSGNSLRPHEGKEPTNKNFWDQFDKITKKISQLQKDLYELLEKIERMYTNAFSKVKDNGKFMPHIKNSGDELETTDSGKEMPTYNNESTHQDENSSDQDGIDFRDNRKRESPSHDTAKTPNEKTIEQLAKETIESPHERAIETQDKLTSYVEKITKKLEEMHVKIKEIDTKSTDIAPGVLYENFSDQSNPALIDRLIKKVHKLIKSDIDTPILEDLTLLTENEDKSIQDSIEKIVKSSSSDEDDSRIKEILREDLVDYKDTLEVLHKKGIPKKSIDNITKKVVDLKDLNITTILKYIAESTTEKSNRKKREIHNMEETAHGYFGLQDFVDNVVRTIHDGVSVHSKDDIMTSGRVKRNIFEKFRRVFRFGHILHKRAIKVDSVKAAELEKIAELFSSIFDKEHADIYFNKAQELVKSGVEPSYIYQGTLRFVVQSLLYDIARKYSDSNVNYNSNELHKLIEDVLETQSKMSLQAFNKRIDDLMLKTTINPIHLMIDVTSQIFFVTRKQLQKEGIDLSEKNAIMTRASDLLIRTFFRIVDDLFVWTFQSNTMVKKGSL